MGEQVHWTKGEHPLSMVADSFNMIAPTLSGTATALSVFTGGVIVCFGDAVAGSVLLASAYPQARILRLNTAHSQHLFNRLSERKEQGMIERESKQEAAHRCRMAFARFAAPLVVFAAAFGLGKLIETPPVPASTASVQATAPAL